MLPKTYNDLIEALRYDLVLDNPRLQLLTGRSEQVIRKNLQQLRIRGFTQRVKYPEAEGENSLTHRHMPHYLTRRGWTYAYAVLKLLPKPIGMGDERTQYNIEHELDLADMRRLFIPFLKDWESCAAFLRIPSQKLVPDRYLEAEMDGEEICGFVENEKSDPKKLKGEFSDFMKFEKYETYWDSGEFSEDYKKDNFRVFVLKPTQEKAFNRSLAIREHKVDANPMRFFFTWPGSQVFYSDGKTYKLSGKPLDL